MVPRKLWRLRPRPKNGLCPDRKTTGKRPVFPLLNVAVLVLPATAAGEPELLEKNRKLLDLYRAHQPYHEAVGKFVPAAP
jgi:hypothetical protein